MKKYTSDQYNKIFWKLPVEIRDVITSYRTTEHITTVGQKHNLHIDKIGELVDVTFDVMMGVVSTKDFIKELEDTLQIPALEAAVLARDIDENIFKPIKETMIHLYAGRAPYKPSSSLVQYYEEDDEHPALDQATLLKEIEDPVEAVVRKEATTIQLRSLPDAGAKLRSLEGNAKNEELLAVRKEAVSLDKNKKPNTNITEYHQEIQNEKEVENKKIITPRPTGTPLILSGEEVRHFPSHLDKGEAGRGLSLESKPNQLTSSQPNQLRGDSILNQIASLKLNQAFVMPKGADGIQELRSLETETVSKVVSELGSEKIKQPVSKLVSLQGGKETTNNLTNLPTNQLPPKIDPYRERI